MRRALITLSLLALLTTLVLAPAAAAENDGRGFYGATNDKVVTNAGFIMIAFTRRKQGLHDMIANTLVVMK